MERAEKQLLWFQLVGGSTYPELSLLHFDCEGKRFNCLKQPMFHLGKVLPSNAKFMSDGA